MIRGDAQLAPPKRAGLLRASLRVAHRGPPLRLDRGPGSAAAAKEQAPASRALPRPLGARRLWVSFPAARDGLVSPGDGPSLGSG